MKIRSIKCLNGAMKLSKNINGKNSQINLIDDGSCYAGLFSGVD